MKKFLLRVMPVLAVLAVIVVSTFSPVLAKNAAQIEALANGNGVTAVDDAVKKVWSTVLTVLQILAIAAIVYAGVKYMFAAAEDKAEIKQGLIGLAVGAILVFGASTIVQFILKVQEDTGLKG